MQRPPIRNNRKTAKTARRIARDTLTTWLSTGLAANPQEINRGAARGGCCDDFAADLCGALKQAGFDVEDHSIDQFLTPGENDGDQGQPFDRKLLRKHWKNVVPPEGTSWENWDALSAAASFSTGTHVFVRVAEADLFFDSECVEGTANFLELPFFTRCMAPWRAEPHPRPRHRHRHRHER